MRNGIIVLACLFAQPFAQQSDTAIATTLPHDRKSVGAVEVAQFRLAPEEDVHIVKARTAIAAGYAKYIEATQRKDATAAANLYDQEAIVLPPGGRPVMGRAEIFEFYKRFYTAPDKLLNESFTPVSLVVQGGLALDIEEERGEVSVPGRGRITFHGKSFVVWKQQADGTWKIFRDMWDEYPPGN